MMNFSPQLSQAASQLLNTLVIELFQRAETSPSQREPRLGALYVLEDPEDINLVLSDPNAFQKDYALVSAIGPSRFNMNGTDWLNLRAKTQRHYAKAGKGHFEDTYAAIYHEEFQRLRKPNATSLEKAVSRAALRCLFSALNVDSNPDLFLPHFQDLRRTAELLQFRSWNSAEKGSTDLMEIEKEVIRVRQGLWETSQSSPGLMAMMTRFSTTGDRFPIETVFADFLTNMFAGIETTTASLLWMFDNLSKNAELQDVLRADVYAGDDACIDGFQNETMRLFSPIPFVVRKLSKPARFGGTDLSMGDRVLLSLVGMHRDPNHWSKPLEFHAARPEFKAGAYSLPSFRPFLAGPRACGGRRIAEMELRVGLRLALKLFRFSRSCENTAFRYSLAFRPVLTDEFKIDRLPETATF